ncbi:hypothetical protein CAOG_08512 [Capsaspora owczarzaki ATCC 30864]|uniref:hypothetical protein n=1 Tax=Capsaspora owczarzaki (strain ATCC 30864) TaxID=595528 RepID=UPI0003525494|nr:hypothetical protein CAOG_08512 [Capsaspora owczarzaki ATCC 30864]|eukprot:XP_011270094.1 hypothetical protein CAOG_08512 [Capsaspora owczarzaki ATCC 30864]
MNQASLDLSSHQKMPNTSEHPSTTSHPRTNDNQEKRTCLPSLDHGDDDSKSKVTKQRTRKTGRDKQKHNTRKARSKQQGRKPKQEEINKTTTAFLRLVVFVISHPHFRTSQSLDISILLWQVKQGNTMRSTFLPFFFSDSSLFRCIDSLNREVLSLLLSGISITSK